jgi:PUA domain protein
MFKRFDPRHDVSTSTQVKTSVQRALKAQLLEQHPRLTEDVLEALLPKKSPLVQYKVGPHLMLYCSRRKRPSDPQRAGEDADADGDEEDEDGDGRSPSDEPVLFQHRDGPLLPALRLVHRYPTLEFSRVTVDRGAIPFLLGGANVMCPGLTNPGGRMPDDGLEEDAGGFGRPGLEGGAGVVIYAEGKEHPLAVGAMAMSTAEV